MPILLHSPYAYSFTLKYCTLERRRKDNQPTIIYIAFVLKEGPYVHFNYACLEVQRYPLLRLLNAKCLTMKQQVPAMISPWRGLAVKSTLTLNYKVSEPNTNRCHTHIMRGDTIQIPEFRWTVTIGKYDDSFFTNKRLNSESFQP